jgi:NAD(P)-dependent dehydrogenase (short-subunit alcohol dehydrogenase family)
MKRFDNRTVIITGGARGLGASHARGFVAEAIQPRVSAAVWRAAWSGRRTLRRSKELSDAAH